MISPDNYEKLLHINPLFLLQSDPQLSAWSSLYYSPDTLHPDDTSILPDAEKGWGMASPPCCGSVVPYAHTRQAPPFTRYVTGPTIEVWGKWNKEVDTIAPGR